MIKDEFKRETHSLPVASKALLEHLNKIFPDKLPKHDPSNGVSIEQIRFFQGQRSVIERMKNEYDEVFSDDT